MIQILTFAQLKEQLQTPCWQSPFKHSTLAQLQQQLIRDFPEAKAVIESSRFAVNQNYAENLNMTVGSQDEIALIPPVSGG